MLKCVVCETVVPPQSGSSHHSCAALSVWFELTVVNVRECCASR